VKGRQDGHAVRYWAGGLLKRKAGGKERSATIRKSFRVSFGERNCKVRGRRGVFSFGKIKRPDGHAPLANSGSHKAVPPKQRCQCITSQIPRILHLAVPFPPDYARSKGKESPPTQGESTGECGGMSVSEGRETRLLWIAGRCLIVTDHGERELTVFKGAPTKK